jgi:hypothetical protein
MVKKVIGQGLGGAFLATPGMRALLAARPREHRGPPLHTKPTQAERDRRKKARGVLEQRALERQRQKE